MPKINDVLDRLRDGISRPFTMLEREEIARVIDDLQASLRDRFAAQALAGLLASTANPNATGPETCPWISWAAQAYCAADAMLKAREATDA